MAKPIQRSLEDGFADSIREGLSGRGYAATDLPVVSGGDTNDTIAPYVVVSCGEIEETTPLSGAYKFELKVVLVSNVDDSISAAHNQRAKDVKDSIDGIPKFAKDDVTQLLGWVLVKEEGVTEEQFYGDVWTVEGGVGVWA